MDKPVSEEQDDKKNCNAQNLQTYTDSCAIGIPVKNQGKILILNMITGLRGHVTISCATISLPSMTLDKDFRKKLTVVDTIKRRQAKQKNLN